MLKLARFVTFVLFYSLLVPYQALLGGERATILKVVDGDTFVVLLHGKEEEVRLLGVDTPEKHRSRKLKEDAARCKVAEDRIRKLGIEATHYAKRLIHKGDQVYLEIGGRGYYGRVLVFVYLKDGTCFTEKIVADGYACVYKYRSRKSRQLSWDEFFKLIRLLNEAKAHKRGLWKIDFEVMNCLCE